MVYFFLLTCSVTEIVCSIRQKCNSSIEDPGMVVGVIVQIYFSVGLLRKNSCGESVVFSGHQNIQKRNLVVVFSSMVNWMES